MATGGGFWVAIGAKGCADYKVNETDDMILNTLNFGPHTCETIKETALTVKELFC